MMVRGVSETIERARRGTVSASLGKRARASYVEARGVLDRRWAKRRDADAGGEATSSASSAERADAADAMDVDADEDGGSSPAPPRRTLGVAAALAFDDAGRGTFPLDPSSTF